MSKIVCFFFALLALGCSKKNMVSGSALTSNLPAAELAQLLEGVPQDAHVVFSAAMPKSFREYSKEFIVPMAEQNLQDMETALRLHFERHQMNDFRDVRAMVGFLRNVGRQPKGAVLMMNGGQRSFSRSSVSEHVVLQSHGNVLVMGDVESVDASIQVLKNKGGLGSVSPLLRAAKTHVPTSYFFAMASGQVLGKNMPFGMGGIDTAWIKMGTKKMSGEIRASESTLSLINTAIGFGKAKVLAEARAKRDRAANDAWGGFGAIVGYFHAKDMIEKLTPTLDKNVLSFDVAMEEGYEKWAAFLGLGVVAYGSQKYKKIVSDAKAKRKLLN